MTDDTLAFQKAAAAAAPTSGCVRVPPVQLGKGYVITGTVVLGMGTKLIGELAGLPAVSLSHLRACCVLRAACCVLRALRAVPYSVCATHCAPSSTVFRGDFLVDLNGRYTRCYHAIFSP